MPNVDDLDTPLQKFIVIMLALIVFTVGMMVGINVLSMFFGPSKSPFLIQGLVPGNVPLIIKQDPALEGSVPISRSDNANYGLEFTWSVWLNITNTGTVANQYQHIFHKGDNNLQADGMNFPNNAPGLYISPETNELVVVMNTFTTIKEEIIIPNVPMNKWVHVLIRVENNKLDVYVNGTLAKRHVLASVVKQNYGNVYVGLNGGFQGYLSDLRYYNYSLQSGDILDIVNNGPNMTVNKQSSITSGSEPPYLALQWYTQEQK
jgi:hypothetical protein